MSIAADMSGRSTAHPAYRAATLIYLFFFVSGMPALIYRYYYRAHSVRSLERNVLGFVGVSPIDETIVGQAGAMSADARGRWLRKITALGRRGV